MISKPLIEIYIFQAISTMHLTRFEVLTAINHAQLHLNRTFKEEEFCKWASWEADDSGRL